MAKEIERKFLLKTLPSELLRDMKPMAVKQGYLVLGQNCELRVREMGDKYFFTTKRGQGMVREEKEASIDQVIFDLVWPFTEGSRVEKSRYTWRQDQAVFDLDIYAGDLQGLQVLEVEFEDIDAANAFPMPDYCAREITDDGRYKNASLAIKGRP